MIYLDTNTLYYACGISEHTQCNTDQLNEIIAGNDVAISIATMYEFVLKWRNNINQIHKIGAFLGTNNIKVFENPYYQLPEKFPLGWNVISETDKEIFVRQILPNKIEVEARLAAIVFSICFISIADFIVQDEHRGTIGEYYMDVFHQMMNMMREADIAVFKNILEEGYTTEDCENYLRKAFDNYMEFWLSCFVPILKTAAEADSYEKYMELETSTDWKALSENISKKINRNQTTMEFIKKRARQHWKNIGDDQLMSYLGDIRKSIDKKISHESMQEYLADIIANILLNGSSFWKNDIIDAVIMSHIRNAGDILITFDKGAINHMEMYKKDYNIYEASLQMINQLKV